MKRLLLLSLSFLLIGVSVARAGLAIQPARAEVTIPAGETFEGTYRVTNESDVPDIINVEYRDWFVLPENKKISIDDWLSVPVKQISFGAGESKDVAYTVHVPSSAQGALVGMVSFVPQAQEGQTLTLVVSAALFVTVAGTEKKDWDLSDIRFATSPKKTLQASVLVTNKGNIHLRPRGAITVYKKNMTVMAMEFAESRPVYPGASRPLVANSENPVALEPGKYVISATVKIGEETKELKARLKVKKNGVFKIK